MPAFTKLDFYGRLDKLGSIIHESETFLLGKIGLFYFRLNLIEPNQKPIKVEIVPLIEIKENTELKTKLEKHFGFRHNVFFGQVIIVTQSDLQNKDFLLDKLLKLEATLRHLEAKQLDVDERMFQE